MSSGPELPSWPTVVVISDIGSFTPSCDVDPRIALLTRMLDLKRVTPLELNGKILPDEYKIGIDREETCPKEDEFDDYRKDHPSWGMPYALPALSDADHPTLVNWVAVGTPHEPLAPLSPQLESSIATWEAFFNTPGLKKRTVSRYRSRSCDTSTVQRWSRDG